MDLSKYFKYYRHKKIIYWKLLYRWVLNNYMETLCIIYSMNNINLTKKCAIIIPTMNKSSFIEDKLYYFNQINYKGTVHIADSSDNYHFDKSAYFINYFSLLG